MAPASIEWTLLLAFWLAVAGCGGLQPPAPPIEPAPAPEVELRAPVLGAARTVLREGSGTYIIIGGVRAHLHRDGIQLAQDAFAAEIVDAVRLADESWVFRDALGTVAWSERFEGSLRRVENVARDPRRARGPHMTFRGADGFFRVTDGGPLRVLAVPERTQEVAVGSADAALAYADGGLLHLTRDGGREWSVIPSDRALSPYFDGSRVVTTIDDRSLVLGPDGQLTEAPAPQRRDQALTGQEVAALVVALSRAGRLVTTGSLGNGRIVVSMAGREHLLSANPRRYLGVCGDADCGAEPGPRVAEDGSAVLLGQRRLAFPARWEATSVIAPSAHLAIALAVPRDPSEQVVLDVALSRPPCQPLLAQDTYGVAPVFAQTALAIDPDTGRVTPLCALPPDQHVTHVFPRADGRFFVRIAHGASNVLVATGTCDSPRPLPAASVGACFVDDVRGVAFGSEHLGQLWHTADGGASWAPLAVAVDGSAAALRGIVADDVRQEGEACLVGPLIVRWRAGRPSQRSRGVLAPSAGAPPVPPACPEPHTATLVCRHDAGQPSPEVAGTRILSASCARGRCNISTSRAGSPMRFTLPARSCPRGAPMFRAEWLAGDGLLVSCERAASCACDAPAYWISLDRHVTALEAPVSSPDQVLRLDDGGFGLLVVDHLGDERVLHLDAAGRLVSSRRFHWREPWPRGIVARESRPMLAVATPGLRAVELYDPADRASARERLPIAVETPSRLCRPEDSGPLLGTRYPLVEILIDGSATGVDGDTRTIVRAQGDETCLAAVALDAEAGDGDLRSEADQLVGTLTREGSGRGVRCRLFHADPN